MMFSLCHATARFPLGWRPAVQDWLEKCDQPEQVEHVLVGDHLRATYNLLNSPGYRVFDRTIISAVDGSWGAVAQWNKAAKLASGKVLIQMADDLFPCEHWDTRLIQVGVPSFKTDAFVFDVDNQDNSAPLIPHAIMTRPYYERFGYIAHPDYAHLCGDCEFTDVARASGCVIDARHLKFKHLTPDDGVEMDEVYKRFRGNPEAFKRDQEVYERRKAAGFPLASVLEAVC